MERIIKIIENSLINNQETISQKSLLEICKSYSIYNTNEIINNFREKKLINNKDILYLPASLQIDLIKEVRNGDKNAREVMILTNYTLVTNIVNHFMTYNLDKEDFVGYGILGLMYAIDNYDLNNTAAFTTYATNCINGYLKKNLPRLISQLSIGRNIYYLNTKIQKIEEKLMKSLGREDISDLEILNELKKSNSYKNIKEEDIYYVRLYSKYTYSLDKEKVTEDGNDLNYTIDCVTSDKDEFEEDIINRIYYEIFPKIFSGEIENKLKPMEIKVLWYRYGFDKENIFRSSDDVGKILGVSGARIRQIEKDALRKLRKLRIFIDEQKELKRNNYF